MNIEATVAPATLHQGGAGVSTATAVRAEIEVRIGRGLNALLALQDDWTAICATRPETGFHHAYGWQLAYLRHLEDDAAAVHIFSCFRGGRPIAIFPLRHAQRIVGGVPLRVWELPFHPHVNLCDAIVARHEDGAAVVRALVAALDRVDLPWDALHLPNLLDDAWALGCVRAAAPPRTLFVGGGRSMFFHCDDIATAMRQCTREFKRNLRRQGRKLDRLGRVELALVREPTALAAAFAAFLRLEAAGWKGDRGSAIAQHPQLVRFYRELIDRFAADGRCLISLLTLDDNVIAAQFGVVAGNTLYLLKTAYDETFDRVAPGHRLLHEMLKHCCGSGEFARLSLVTSPAWAAERWSPDAQGLWHAYVFNASARGRLAHAATRLKAAAARLAGLGPREGSGRQPAQRALRRRLGRGPR